MAQARYRRPRRTQSWETYANACALLGALQIARGDRAGAEQSFLLAFRLGRRAGILPARRDGAFGLLRLSLGRAELTVGDERDAHLQQADRYAVAASRAHREDRPGPARCWSGSRGIGLIASRRPAHVSRWRG